MCFVGIINIKNDVIWFGKHFPLIVNAHQVGKRRQFLDGGGGGRESRYIFTLLCFSFGAEAGEN